MKKPMKIFLGIAGTLALLGICIACLAVYAKKEINTPKFEMPKAEAVEPIAPLPDSKEAAFDYVNSLYNACISADDIELSRHTDVHLTNGERVTPFSEADNEVFARALENAQGAISALYPANESTLITKLDSIPQLGFTKSDVAEFTAEKGYNDENGENIDDGNYNITLTVSPSVIDSKAMAESEIAKSIKKELEAMLSVSSLEIIPEGFTASFRIDYATNQLTWVELKQNLKVKAAVDFTEEYKALSDKTAELEIPYEAVQCIDLFHYGIRFTQRQMAVQIDDMKALPLDVRVNPETTKEDYKLSFDVSDKGILKIDEDGVMSVVGTQEKPVTVTARLEYDNHTYTDQLIIYATDLEVKTDEQNIG